jgi:hypothetical protein
MYRQSSEVPSDARNNPTPSSGTHALHVQLTAGSAVGAIFSTATFVFDHAIRPLY